MGKLTDLQANDFPKDIRFGQSVLRLNDRGWGHRVKGLPSARKSLDFICNRRRDTGGNRARGHIKPENGNKERKRGKCMLR